MLKFSPVVVALLLFSSLFFGRWELFTCSIYQDIPFHVCVCVQVLEINQGIFGISAFCFASLRFDSFVAFPSLFRHVCVWRLSSGFSQRGISLENCLVRRRPKQQLVVVFVVTFPSQAAAVKAVIQIQCNYGPFSLLSKEIYIFTEKRIIGGSHISKLIVGVTEKLWETFVNQLGVSGKWTSYLPKGFY